MAVAITLLVLNLEVPTAPGDELGEELQDLLPDLAAYALSFALIGRFWVLHHRLFDELRTFDGPLMALNLLFLSLVVLLPFSTDLVDHYGEEPLAAAVFGATVGLASLAQAAMSAYVLRENLVRGDMHRRPNSRFAFAYSLIFLLSVPLAFASPRAAQAVWLSTLVVRYPLRRLIARSRTSQ